MKAKAFFIVLLAIFTANVLSSQSLESQLKIIFGDALSTFGKNDFSRFLGKSLTTSGNMNYNMEVIRAQNNQTLNVNVNMPPNTYLGSNNQIMPNQGYQWANPSNASDYSVIPAYTRSYPTLPPYDLNYLNKMFTHNPREVFFSGNHIGSTLNVLFTYNWMSDINGDGKFSFPEYNNVKRTFYRGEPICYSFSFAALAGTKHSGKGIGDAINFLVQIFDAATGRLIAKRNYSHQNNAGSPRHEIRIFYESLGNYLPTGKYIVAVGITSISRIEPGTVLSLREYFEVIE